MSRLSRRHSVQSVWFHTEGQDVLDVACTHPQIVPGTLPRHTNHQIPLGVCVFFGLFFPKNSHPKFTSRIVGIPLQFHFLEPKIYSRRFSACGGDQKIAGKVCSPTRRLEPPFRNHRFRTLIFCRSEGSLVAHCSATPATVAATPPCSATPFQNQISVRHLPAHGGGGGATPKFLGGVARHRCYTCKTL